jgi:hypothetical protein
MASADLLSWRVDVDVLCLADVDELVDLAWS